MPFSTLFLDVFIQVKNRRVSQNEVEIDTIDNDDEKESIEVSENMTQYPTNPFKFCKIKSFKNKFPH